jgi:hypothetical protein
MWIKHIATIKFCAIPFSITYCCCEEATMRATSIYQAFSTLFMLITLTNAASLTKTKENTKKFNNFERLIPKCLRSKREQRLDCLKQEKALNALFSGTMSPTRFETTKSALLEKDGSRFHNMLALDKKGIILPETIGKCILSICIQKIDLEVLFVAETILDYLIPIPTWDPEYCANPLTLQNNNRVVSKDVMGVAGGAFYGVQSAKPCSRYSVQIVKGQRIFIGFAPRLGFRGKGSNFKTCGWFLHVSQGSLYAQDGTRAKAYGTAIPVGSVVTAIHDASQHQIEFHVDGKSLGIAFNNVPYDELFAAADLYDLDGAELRFVEF